MLNDEPVVNDTVGGEPVLVTFDADTASGVVFSRDLDGQTLVVIRTASVETRSAFIEGMIKGENFFDVENNPEILFVSKRLDWTSKDTAELKGDLTMRGTTKPVTFYVSLEPLNGPTISQAEKVVIVLFVIRIYHREEGLAVLA